MSELFHNIIRMALIIREHCSNWSHCQKIAFDMSTCSVDLGVGYRDFKRGCCNIMRTAHV